jgi:uncharacterized FAD-dependent dehydrogenase
VKKIQIKNITVPLETSVTELKRISAKKAGIREKDILGFKIARRSVDARRNTVSFNYSIILEIPKRIKTSTAAVPFKEYCEENINKGDIPLKSRPVIAGAGPAGLFCAYILAREGYRPIVFERGSSVEERTKITNDFCLYGKLNTECNIQFGEGGAGTFSDGKLTTRIGSPLCELVLKTFAECGAKEEILYMAKPHIGTDMLGTVIKNLRNKIISLGGEFHFNCTVSDIKIQKGKVVSVITDEGEFETDIFIVATGHSARDTYYMLYKKGLDMEPKAFAMGVRIEHLQSFIDEAQYGSFAGHPLLGAADYRLAYNGTDRSCFSFCMCPGGTVAAAASEESTVVVNGMSNNARDGINANSALAVSVTPSDYEGVLGGIELQRKIERAAYRITSSYFAPVQNTSDFLNNTKSKKITGITPSYPIGTMPSDLRLCLPEFICSTLCDGLRYFDTKIKGFTKNSVLTAPETRTSAPVRILRSEDHVSTNIKGIYPTGEGAGYAGGIMSSAVDGIKSAYKIIEKYKPV